MYFFIFADTVTNDNDNDKKKMLKVSLNAKFTLTDTKKGNNK